MIGDILIEIFCNEDRCDEKINFSLSLSMEDAANANYTSNTSEAYQRLQKRYKWTVVDKDTHYCPAHKKASKQKATSK